MENEKYVGKTRHFLTCTGYEVLENQRYVLEVRCVCGTVKKISTTKFGVTKSCGCYQHRPKHGKSRTSVYRRYLAIRQRCENEKNAAFSYYGGRGIRCLWESFEDFYRDMGDPPTPKHSIERTNLNGHYCKDNCVWADMVTQMNNTRHNTFLEWQGERMTIAQWSRRLGVKQNSISVRLREGWSVERTLTTPFPTKKCLEALEKNNDEDREPEALAKNRGASILR